LKNAQEIIAKATQKTQFYEIKVEETGKLYRGRSKDAQIRF